MTRRARPEQRPTFVLTLWAAPGVDAVRALRWALKFLWRRFGLRCVEVIEQREDGGRQS
jgi:hypothetical protein